MISQFVGFLARATPLTGPMINERVTTIIPTPLSENRLTDIRGRNAAGRCATLRRRHDSLAQLEGPIAANLVAGPNDRARRLVTSTVVSGQLHNEDLLNPESLVGSESASRG